MSVYMLALLLNYSLLLHTRAYARMHSFYLTATTAHTYDAPAMTNSNTRMKERERERRRDGWTRFTRSETIACGSCYRFATNLTSCLIVFKSFLTIICVKVTNCSDTISH